MPRRAHPFRKQIETLLGDFAAKIQAVVERNQRPAWPDDVRARVLAALGLKRGPGRPPGSGKASRGPVAKRKRRPQTAAQKRANKLQGQYMGTIRLLPAASKAKVKAIREKDGVRAAIKAARGMKAA